MDERKTVTRRNYKKKKGIPKGVKIIIWTVVFLLCFFVPFFIIYFGSNDEPVELGETVVAEGDMTPEARIYQLEQENEQLRNQIRDLEARIDELSKAQNPTTDGAQDPAMPGGWEEMNHGMPEEEEEETATESSAAEATTSAASPAETAPTAPSTETTPTTDNSGSFSGEGI